MPTRLSDLANDWQFIGRKKDNQQSILSSNPDQIATNIVCSEAKTLRNVSGDVIVQKLLDSNFSDELTGNKLILKDSSKSFSRQNCIFDLHHIVPFSYRTFLSKDKTQIKYQIHDPRNLIVLDPGTHALLHRQIRKEKKQYLSKMWEQVCPLIHQVNSPITFELFELMY